MIGHIFYFLGLMLTLFNIGLISTFKKYFKIREWFVKFNKVTSNDPVESDFKKGEYAIYISNVVVLSTNFLWIFFGLLTSSWQIFLTILTFNILFNLICRLIGEFSGISFVIQFIKMILITSLSALLVINHFHLHIDLWNLIQQVL